MNLKGTKFDNAKLGMEIYVYEFDGREWFIGKNMCDILEYGNSREAIKKHVWDKEKTTIYVKSLENIEKSQNMTSQTINNNMTLITEVGLYQLVFRSKMPKAEEFQKWIFSEVLPSIRKNGMYAVANITKEQIELYTEENREFKRVMMNMKSGLARSKSLEVWVNEIAPDIEGAYEQVLEQLKAIGVIDNKCMPTEKFREANRHGKWFSHNIKTTSDTTIKITLLEKGIVAMSKIIKVVDGKISLEKFKYDLKLN